MKLCAAVLAVFSSGALGATVVRLDASSQATPQDVAECVAHVSGVVDRPMSGKGVVEKVVDKCTLDARIDDRNYVCSHLREGLEGLFFHTRGSSSALLLDEEVSAADFCKLTENHFLGLRDATRIPNIGSGPLLDFKLSSTCNSTVKAAIAPKTRLTAPEVPDFWYALCMNQDCAHFLPSRTRWCNVGRRPTHSAETCEAVRRFAKSRVSTMAKSSWGSTGTVGEVEICNVYGDFAKEMGINVEAYEHAIHADTRRNVPKPDDASRALRSAQMVNAAGAHYLRDNAGSAPKAGGLVRLHSGAEAHHYAYGLMVALAVAHRLLL